MRGFRVLACADMRRQLLMCRLFSTTPMLPYRQHYENHSHQHQQQGSHQSFSENTHHGYHQGRQQSSKNFSNQPHHRRQDQEQQGYDYEGGQRQHYSNSRGGYGRGGYGRGGQQRQEYQQHHHRRQQPPMIKKTAIEERSSRGLSSSPNAKAVSESCVVKVTDAVGKPLQVQPLRKFSDLEEDFPEWLREGLHKTGYEAPMPVQSFAIPLLLQDRDVIGLAPTGTGKTVAFAVPSLATIDIKGKDYQEKTPGVARPSILVLCPTRELVQQTAVVFHVLGNGFARVAECYGGSEREKQGRELSKGCDVLIATPGRLCDFLDAGVITLDDMSFLVMDEADRMLEMGFTTQLEYIMSRTNAEVPRRTMMWSATWPESVRRLAMSYLKKDHVRVTAGDPRQNKSIQQRFYVTEEFQRMKQLGQLFGADGPISAEEKVLVFVAKKTTIENFADELRDELHWLNPKSIQTLHGAQKQEKRDKVIDKFRSGDIRILFATEVAARGLDIPDIEHVVNFDAPGTIERYIHRIGRTGRAGRSGVSHTFLLATGGATTSAQSEADFAVDLLAHLKENDTEVSEELTFFVRQKKEKLKERVENSKRWKKPGVTRGPRTFTVARK